MDKETFEMVDGILANKDYHDDREAAVAILEVGVREGTLADAAQVVAGRYALQPEVVVEWFGEILNRRLQHIQETLKKLGELTNGHV